MEDRIARAVQNHKNGYSCSQAVFCSFCDRWGIAEEDGCRLAEGFGSGMGRLHLTCGAVTAMFLLAGLKLGSGVPGDGSTRDETYETVQSLAAAFTERCGTTVCGELLAQNEREPGRTCTDYVACAAALVDSMLCGSESENRP